MSEIDDLEAYYKNLLIKQYHQPRAQETIGGLARSLACDLIFSQIRDGFNIDTAVGAQLDILAKYVGAIRTPTGVPPLSDADLRFLIKMKIIQNVTNNSLKSIDDYMDKFFGQFGTNVVLSDNLDMTLTFSFSIFFSQVMTLALATNSLPRPMGVAIILSPTSNPNGEFGLSEGGIAGANINGLGFAPDAYEGGTLVQSIIG
jgi:hypothetical protein